jgi:hypothetical protein
MLKAARMRSIYLLLRAAGSTHSGHASFSYSFCNYQGISTKPGHSRIVLNLAVSALILALTSNASVPTLEEVREASQSSVVNLDNPQLSS